MSPHVKFSQSIPGADRLHYVNAEDVRIVLSRLPLELWQRLRTVHFNDRSHGARVFGYVNRGRREIALCALPPRLSLRRVLVKGQTPAQFGAKPGHTWPVLAVRRFMLYDVFLHELGHLLRSEDPKRRLLTMACWTGTRGLYARSIAHTSYTIIYLSLSDATAIV